MPAVMRLLTIAALTSLAAGSMRRSSTPAGATSREQANTEAAVDLLVGAFSRHEPRTVALRHIDAQTYIQHNPRFADGRQAFIDGIGHFVQQFPQASVVIRRTIAQDDMVVVQNLFRTGPDDRGTAVVDTFRFNSDGKIVEHWDVLQPLAEASASGNPQI